MALCCAYFTFSGYGYTIMVSADKSCGSAPTTGRTSTRTFRLIRISRFRSPAPTSVEIRLSGKVVFEDNAAVKEGCMENPIVKGQYQTADNPIFEVFYPEDALAVIADFSGKPPKEYSL